MAKNVTDGQLVKMIYELTSAMIGIDLFPYQQQPAKRIIRSVIKNDGDELTSLQARQSGKSEVVTFALSGLMVFLPILANSPFFAGDKRLEPFKDGIMIGVFGPALQQSQIIFNRVRSRLGSERAIEFMADPEIGVSLEISNGENVSLSNGSFMSAVSASVGSNIEGRSYHLIIIDEAQDVNDTKYSKSISPMGAFYNATKVLIGTPNFTKGFFFYAIERNKRNYANKTGRRNHFEYNWEYVVKYNEKYAKYIEGEKARLGEDSDEFQMSYNLQWKLERGMFITLKEIESWGNRNEEALYSDMSRTYVVGIDVAKSSDSTVMTFMEVDFNSPLIVEESQDMGVPDFVVYPKKIRKWVQIDNPDFEQQYYDILRELRLFNVVRLVIDATSMGGPIYSRLRANLGHMMEVMPYEFSTSSKSELYIHYDREFKAGRISYPAGEETRIGIPYRRFISEHTELTKEHRGKYLVVKHPEIRGAKDDYPDSGALAVWGARGNEVSVPKMEDNVFSNDIGYTESFYSNKNSYTARRR